MLKEKSEITYKSTFEESKRFLENDERYVLLSRYAREEQFNRYIKELQDNLKTQFKQMLKESSYITKDSQTKGSAFDDLVKVLRMADVRFRRMDSWPEERDAILKQYIERLKNVKKK